MRLRTTTLRRLMPLAAVLSVALALLTGTAIGQVDDEDEPSPASAAATVLQSRLSFRYVANAQANPRPKSEVLDNKAIAAGTFSGTFFSNARMAPLQAMVKALLCTPAQGGDLQLQRFTHQILSLSKKPVAVMLIDDNAALTATMTVGGKNVNIAEKHWGVSLDTNNRVWPSAWHAEGTGAWEGAMTLGQHNLNNNSQFKGKPKTINSTFLHELMHTKDRSDGRSHLYVVDSKSYSYGPDETHYGVEAIPNRAMVYAEGLANAVNFMYNPAARQEYFQWFQSNGLLLVEKTAPPADIATTAWLYNQLKAADATEVKPDVASNYKASILARYAFYRVRDLPASLIAHNEMILAMTLSYYTRYVPAAEFFAALREANTSLDLVCASGTAVLFENLCRRAQQRVAATSDARADLIPLAFADYFTGYNASSEEEFGAIFENLLPQDLLEEYWVGYRTAVRAAVPITTPKESDLTDLAIALGVTSTTARAASPADALRASDLTDLAIPPSGTSTTVRAAAPAAHGSLSRAGGGFALYLDGTRVADLRSVSLEPLTLEVEMGASKGFSEWIGLFLDDKFSRRSGEIHALNEQAESIGILEFQGAYPQEVTFPALDASSKDAAYMTVRAGTDQVISKPGTGTPVQGEAAPKVEKLFRSNFRVDIGDLPCGGVSKVDAMTWKMKVVESRAGSSRAVSLAPGKVETPSVRLTISMADVAPWRAWVDRTIRGAPADVTGTIEFIAPDHHTALARIDLYGLSPLSLQVPQTQTDREHDAHFTVELGCTDTAFTDLSG